MVNIKNVSFAVDRRDGLTYGMSYPDWANEEYTRTNQVQRKIQCHDALGEKFFEATLPEFRLSYGKFKKVLITLSWI